ncbi:MAG: carbohydrate ABC transporter permease [Coprobacillus sp.]
MPIRNLDVKKAKALKIGGKFGVSLFRFILIAGISFVILFPLASKLLASFMTVEDIYDMSVQYIPKHFTLENYALAWNFLDMPSLIPATLFYPFITSLVTMASATVVAYGFARYEFKGKGFLFILVVLGMVIPPDLVLLPLYMNFRYFDFFGIIKLITGSSLNLLDTPFPFVILGLTCTGLKNGLYIFMMRQYFRGLPKELEEAAFVDGASTFKAFIKIFIPSATQIMMTVFLFSFVWQWVDDLYTSTFIQNVPFLSTEMSRLVATGTVSAGISNMTQFGLMRNAGIVFFIAPLLILYIVCQKYFTESIERSGIVG